MRKSYRLALLLSGEKLVGPARLGGATGPLLAGGLVGPARLGTPPCARQEKVVGPARHANRSLTQSGIEFLVQSCRAISRNFRMIHYLSLIFLDNGTF